MTRISPLNSFFSLYSKFQHRPRNPPLREFNRLAREYQFRPGSTEMEAARDKFKVAMKREFDSIYGSDEEEIGNWHKLCHVLKIDPVPNTIKECRAAVSKKYVNLVDLVHLPKTEIPVFKSAKDLSEYTHKSKKFFPREDAEDGGVLRALRRRILEPQESPSKPGKSYYRRTVKSIPIFGVPPPSRDLGSRPSPTLPRVRHPRHVQPHPSGDPA